jgi:hypothetical protein
MAVKLNQRGFEHAKKLVREGRYVIDERDAWSEHQPTTKQQNAFIQEHGFGEYGLWFLGIDDEKRENTKARYKFPYGDFENVHRCGLLAAESRAGQRNYFDIELAVAHLHGMLDALAMVSD